MKFTIKHLILLALMCCMNWAHAIYVENMPIARIQPNGDTLHCFATGDECYHRLHDANGYTIVMDSEGYWVYAISDGNGNIAPSKIVAGSTNPAELGLTPGLSISRTEWINRRKAWEVPESYRTPATKTSGRNHGDYCNLVIFVRFADDAEYTLTEASLEQMFSDSTSESSNSLYNYFKHASYNKIHMRTYYAPQPQNGSVISYQDSHPRAYYMPYSASNTLGYQNYNQRTDREFELLVGAVNYINSNAPVPTNCNLDCDNDGNIDNVNFIVKGTYTGWSDLLWPHKWNLYGREVYINGKRVNTFNMQLEGSGPDYFGVSTFCHEMNHSLGAPDLYRYNTGTEVSPASNWDLMATNTKPPQHMSAYMKYKYGNWIDSIPTITTPGRYTLHSLADSANTNNCYRIPSCDSNQFYVLEYRDNRETFEGKLPGSGLLIWRIDKRFDGNAGYDGITGFDEVWLFRPGSHSGTESGNAARAYFSLDQNRTEFSPSTDPYPFLSDGTRDLNICISSIGLAGNTIEFYYSNKTEPIELVATRTTSATATLQWKGNGEAFAVTYRPKGQNAAWQHHLCHSQSTVITGLEANTLYEWRVRNLYNRQDGGSYSDSSTLAPTQTFHTELCNNVTTDTVGSSANTSAGMPFANGAKYNYSQQLFLSSEMQGSMHISTIKLNYAGNSALNTKTNCTIYMGHTTLESFADDDSIVPARQLRCVYSGALKFENGWNEIVLDTPFLYNADSNLVVALDDNSEASTMAGHKFHTTATDSMMSVIFSSQYSNPEPEDSITFRGDKRRVGYRTNIIFTGCPLNSTQPYVCVVSNNTDLGRVAGEGYYENGASIRIYAFPYSGQRFRMWNDSIADNPRDIVVTQDTLFIAYFYNPLAIEEADKQSGYIVMTSNLHITIQGAVGEPVRIYDALGRCLYAVSSKHDEQIRFDAPVRGLYLIQVGNQKANKVLVN